MEVASYYICENVECSSMLRFSESEAKKYNFRCMGCGRKMGEELVPYQEYRFAKRFEEHRFSISIIYATLCTVYFSFTLSEKYSGLKLLFSIVSFSVAWWVVNSLIYTRTLQMKGWRTSLPKSENNLWPIWGALSVLVINITVFAVRA